MAGKHIRFDWAIKKLLRNKANYVILEGFISELLKKDVEILSLLESESNQLDIQDKFNRVDILAKDNNGELFLIEVQNEKENDFFHRMLYGASKIITEQLNVGNQYGSIKKVYSINIVYFDLGQGNDYIYKGETRFEGIHTKEELKLSNKQKELFRIEKVHDIFTTYFVLKVNSFDNVAKDTLDEWIYFLKNNEIKDEFQAKGLPQAKEILRVDNLNAIEKAEYENHVKIERIRHNEYSTAIEDGKELAKKEYIPLLEQERKEKEEAKKREEEAKFKAEKERKEKEEANLALIKMINKMLERGFSLEEIAEDLGKSVAEIKDLLSCKF